MVPRRQPAPVAPLFAVSGAAVEGAPRRRPDAGLRAARGPSQGVSASRARLTHGSRTVAVARQTIPYSAGRAEPFGPRGRQGDLPDRSQVLGLIS
jgi:hypothetical protein